MLVTEAACDVILCSCSWDQNACYFQVLTMKSIQRFKAMLGTYKEKEIVLAYRVGCALAGLLVLGVTTYDIHRSIKNNELPPSREQLDYLASKISDSREKTKSPYLEGLKQDVEHR
ncbi:hypothetical protein R1flu_015001 [Riccia fluitans]|uniref:Uncharacterized protein n=1 Tax=Riccia fluitans TaxID=41844 RepID=A0ABD1YI33_9MARC